MTDTKTLSLLFRIGTAERQLENLDVPAEVLDRIAHDVAKEGGPTAPPVVTEDTGHGRVS